MLVKKVGAPAHAPPQQHQMLKRVCKRVGQERRLQRERASAHVHMMSIVPPSLLAYLLACVWVRSPRRTFALRKGDNICVRVRT